MATSDFCMCYAAKTASGNSFALEKKIVVQDCEKRIIVHCVHFSARKTPRILQFCRYHSFSRITSVRAVERALDIHSRFPRHVCSMDFDDSAVSAVHSATNETRRNSCRWRQHWRRKISFKLHQRSQGWLAGPLPKFR